MAAAKYAKPPQHPPAFVATASSLLADAKSICEHSRSILDRIATDVKPETASWDTVLKPMVEDENLSALRTRIIGFYQAVSADSELRDASAKAEAIMDEFGIEASMREDIFALVEAAYQRGEKLDEESQRLLEKERKSYIRNGLGIKDPKDRERFKEIKKRLSAISIQFSKNLNEENGGIWFTRKQLEGVPEDVLSTLEVGKDENEGKLRLSFKYPDLFPTLKFALDAETRKQVFVQNENKVSRLSTLIVHGVNADSATTMFLSSRKQSYFGTRPLDFLVIQTTPRSGSKTRWQRHQRQLQTFFLTFEHSSHQVVQRKSSI